MPQECRGQPGVLGPVGGSNVVTGRHLEDQKTVSNPDKKGEDPALSYNESEIVSREIKFSEIRGFFIQGGVDGIPSAEVKKVEEKRDDQKDGEGNERFGK